MFDMKSSSNKPRGAVRDSVVKRSPVLRLRYPLFMIIFAALAWSAWTIRNSVPDEVMPFEHVGINGDFVNLSPEQVADTVKRNLDGDYFTLDLAIIRSALLELPWVQEVSVRRIWPSGLDITINEKQPVAHWGEGALLSDRGEVFTPDNAFASDVLPSLVGPQGLHAQVWDFYIEVSEQLIVHDRYIRELTLDGRRSWSMRLDQGAYIKLGRNHIEDRLHRLDQLLSMEDALDIMHVKTIDMRYPNGFAVSEATDDEQNKITSMQGVHRAVPVMSEV